jgi:hypothetical protein
MKFSIGMLLALVATNQLVAAAPIPIDWNGKDAEAMYVLNPMTLKITSTGN